MRTISRTVVTYVTAMAVLLTCLVLLQQAVSAGELEPVPKSKLKDVQGNSFRVPDYKGKVVLVNFWAVWCPPCKLEIPSLQELSRTYGSQVVVIGIAVDSGSDEKVRDTAKELGITYPVVNGDYDVRAMFGGIRVVPTTMLVNQESEICKTYLGNQEKQVLEEDIKALLAGKELPLEKPEP